MEKFETKEQYLEIKKAWSEYVNGGEERVHVEPYQLALYALLRNKDWRKSFSEHSKYETIDSIYYAITSSKYLDLSCFGSVVTDAIIAQLRTTDIPKWEI